MGDLRVFILFTSILLFSLAGCTNGGASFEGVVAQKIETSHNSLQILVIPNIEPEAIEGLSEQQIIKLAQQNDAKFFPVSKKTFETSVTGKKVEVWYEASGGVDDSNPPIQHGVQKVIFK